MRKQFFYTGKTYNTATYRERYTRESRWKSIFYTMSGNPYFVHMGRRYKLDDFLRAGTMWSVGYPEEITAQDGETVTLAGYEAESYYKPIFIEIDESGERCRVYRYEGSETDYSA